MSRSLSMLLFIVIFLPALSRGQSGTGQDKVPRPKLVVGIVVDQMRWDYLYRYYDRYSPDEIGRAHV